MSSAETNNTGSGTNITIELENEWFKTKFVPLPRNLETLESGVQRAFHKASDKYFDECIAAYKVVVGDGSKDVSHYLWADMVEDMGGGALECMSRSQLTRLRDVLVAANIWVGSTRFKSRKQHLQDCFNEHEVPIIDGSETDSRATKGAERRVPVDVHDEAFLTRVGPGENRGRGRRSREYGAYHNRGFDSSETRDSGRTESVGSARAVGDMLKACVSSDIFSDEITDNFERCKLNFETMARSLCLNEESKRRAVVAMLKGDALQFYSDHLEDLGYEEVIEGLESGKHRI
jgi:hypothetical protein